MARLVNFENKNPTLRRMMRFIEAMGGITKVARQIGRSDQVFRSMVNRDTKPSVDLLIDIAEAYPEEFSIDYVLTGRDKVRDEVDKLKRELEVQRAVVERLVGKPKATTRSLLIDREVPENRMLAPKHISVFCQEIIDRLIATYGFYRFPSVN